MKCIKCGKTGRDTRCGLCDLCAFKGKTMATRKKKTPPRKANGQFRRRKKG